MPGMVMAIAIDTPGNFAVGMLDDMGGAIAMVIGEACSGGSTVS